MLKPHIDSLTIDKASLQQFTGILAEAYDTLTRNDVRSQPGAAGPPCLGQSRSGSARNSWKEYDALGEQGEVPVEAVYRQCVLAVQPTSFWVTAEPSKFQSLTRPMFRCRLSAMLAENLKPADGRELRLTPTVTRKDIWELFSPAEGRVVQVGRLAFIKG